jgi:superfamily II DNA or RNA helicase
VKWFLENDPVWKSEVDKVWMWDDYPDRWGKDCGIDLVFRDKNNETWAVQAKCYDREYPVTKTDVDSFLSESNRPLIQRRLLIATTDNLGPNARKVCAEQEKPVTLFLFSDFEDSAIDYPESISDLSRAKLKPKPQPTGKYSYQLEPINAVVDKFKAHDKGQLIMACGTGKTFTTLWIKEKLNAETTLILLPSLSLLSQTLKEWTFAMNQPFKSLCVCSDETVNKGASEDQLLESVQDLSFPVTADPNLIRKFLNSPGTKVLFSTYQSSPMIAEAQKMKDVPVFDLVIADEAHRCAGKVSSSFTTVLNDDLIRSKKKLFTTATPRTYSSNLKKQAEELDFEISGMDDEKVFGTEFYRLSFGNAIERGLLTDYQLVIIGVDEPMIADWIKRRELLQTNDEIVDAKSLAAEIGLIKAIKDYNLKRVLSFHSRVKSAEDFSKELPKVLDLIDESHKPKGKLATGFVSGKMPTNQRRLKLDQLKELTQGDYAVLSNARCLSEGVDVPALDGIAIVDPKASQIDIVQTVGRAIRLSENKSVGTIIIPVFIENGDDPEASIESTNFKPLWEVVKALRSHDEMLAFELDALRTEMGKLAKRSVKVGGLKKIVIDVPQSVNSNFSDSLRSCLVEHVTASWNFWYGLLQKYFLEFNTTRCNVDLVYEGFTLGRWTSTQRSNKNTGLRTISQEKILLLEKFPDWTWDINKFLWEKNYEFLLKFVNENGKINFQLLDVINPATNTNVNVWCATQKDNYRNKIFEPNSQLNENTIRLLEDLAGWSWNKLRYDKWENYYNGVLDYFKLDPQGDNFSIPDPKLRRWCKTQCDNFNDKKLFPYSELNQERIERLSSNKQWLWKSNKIRTIDVIINYYKLHGHLIFTSEEKVDGVMLSKALRHIRADKKNGILSPEDEKKFKDIKSWDWDGYQYLWTFKYDLIFEYTKSNHIANIPKIFTISNREIKIQDWINTQKKDYKNKSEFLTQEKINKLLKIPNWTWGVTQKRKD